MIETAEEAEEQARERMEEALEILNPELKSFMLDRG